MLDTLQDKFEETFSGDSFPGTDNATDNADERNLGVSPTESMVAFAVALGTTFLVRNALQAGWRTTFNRAPPKNPTSSEVDWQDALLWGVVSGAFVGVARIASRRVSSQAYRHLRR